MLELSEALIIFMYNDDPFVKLRYRKHMEQTLLPQNPPICKPLKPALKNALQFDWLCRNQTYTDLDEVETTNCDKWLYYGRYFDQTPHLILLQQWKITPKNLNQAPLVLQSLQKSKQW